MKKGPNHQKLLSCQPSPDLGVLFAVATEDNFLAIEIRNIVFGTASIQNAGLMEDITTAGR
jgi:hypothetical protein